MNKTVNMNLGGIFFHIDEDAYQKLNRYFDAIKSSLDAEAREEIMNDIESRIAEIFNEKLAHSKQVLGLSDVDDVIAIMGQPEDYKIENDEKTQSFNYTTSKTKKLYRDTDNAKIAGVCAGLGHYFGVDAVWIRIILVLLVFAGFGTGILAYIILWAVTPEAITTSEKLEMTGEPITISNIEKKVKEEFENISEKFKNQDFSKMNENVRENVNKFNDSFRSTAKKTRGDLADVIISIMKVFAKLIGAFIVFISGIALIGLLISLFTFGSGSILKTPWMDYLEAYNYTGTSFWFIGLLSVLAIGIPFFFLLLLGLKILVTNLKSIGNVAKLTLLGVWLLAVGVIITIVVKQANEFKFENKVVDKQILNINTSDTLNIKFKYNEYYAKDIYRDNFRLVQDSTGHDYIYSNEVELYIKPTDENQPYILIEKNADGKSLSEARQMAERINYGFKMEGNTLVFDNYFITDAKSKYRDQEVSIYLFVPKGLHIKPDSSMVYYDRTDGDYFTFYPSSNDYIYKVGDEKIKCINCPADIEHSDDDDDVNITINENGLKIKNNIDTIINPNEIKELKINEDGIIIKTK